jgi:hypothetical protein
MEKPGTFFIIKIDSPGIIGPTITYSHRITHRSRRHYYPEPFITAVAE